MTRPTFPETLPLGEPLEVAEGLWWVRLALPFQLNHVNVYLLCEDDGWTAVDTGVNNPESRENWQKIFAFIGGITALKRLIVTHHHVDHVGLAGWLASETGCAVFMSAGEQKAAHHALQPDHPDRVARMSAHLRWLGCDGEEIAALTSSLFRATTYMGPLPGEIGAISPGDDLRIGNRIWHVLPGKGHSVEPVMLHCPEESLLIAGDQILSSISPFIGTFGDAPLASPLRDYLAFLAGIEKTLPEDTLVLGGHGRPFDGALQRIASLKAHHAERCDKIVEACRAKPLTIRDMMVHIFTRTLDGVMTMALAEVLSHVNLLVDEGRLVAGGNPEIRTLSTP